MAISIATATMAFASSCKKANPDRAYALAACLVDNMHDTASLCKAVCDIETWLDSLKEFPADAVIARETLLQQSTRAGGDSANLIVQTVLYNATALGKKISKECCTQLIDSMSDSRALASRINIIRNTYTACGKPTELKQFDMAFQDYVDSLPIEEQMRIYSCATSKLKLSIAIRNEALDDPVKAGEAIEALKRIYSKEDFSEFMQYYSSK